jgi:hypothetical protein
MLDVYATFLSLHQADTYIGKATVTAATALLGYLCRRDTNMII